METISGTPSRVSQPLGGDTLTSRHSRRGMPRPQWLDGETVANWVRDSNVCMIWLNRGREVPRRTGGSKRTGAGNGASAQSPAPGQVWWTFCCREGMNVRVRESQGYRSHARVVPEGGRAAAQANRGNHP